MLEFIEEQSKSLETENGAPQSSAIEANGRAACEAPAQDPPAPSEDELLEAARNGDHPAFGELILRHYSECFKRAMSMMRNRSDAEDEVQNAASKAFQRLEQFRSEGTFAA